jgi:superfamily I DNA/RNA helicase
LEIVRSDHFPDLIDKGFSNPPVLKPKKKEEITWYEKISEQWDLLGHQIRKYIEIYATTYYSPYLRAYEAFKDVFEEVKKKEGKIDFEDQVKLVVQLFRRRPSVLREFQEKFKYILVDEFQDTNYIQFELLKMMAARHQNLTVVGDDDQSIFRFRGASLSNILNFKKHFPEAREIVLTKNYRSTQPILDSAYKLIQQNNPNRLEFQYEVDKRLVSSIEAPPRTGATPGCPRGGEGTGQLNPRLPGRIQSD